VYSIDRCTAALMHSLRNDGLTVYYIYPYKLKISWKIFDEKEEKVNKINKTDKLLTTRFSIDP
jgi:hypothetical protein